MTSERKIYLAFHNREFES